MVYAIRLPPFDHYLPFSANAYEAQVHAVTAMVLQVEVAPGQRLGDHPGVYPALGVAYYKVGSERRIAIQPRALAAHVRAEADAPTISPQKEDSSPPPPFRRPRTR